MTAPSSLSPGIVALADEIASLSGRCSLEADRVACIKAAAILRALPPDSGGDAVAAGATCYVERSLVRMILLARNDELGLRAFDELKIYTADDFTAQAATPTRRPVAWRCKDYADGWVVFQDEEAAFKYHVETDCLMQGMYVRDGSPAAATSTAPVAWIVKWSTKHTLKNASAYLAEADAKRAAANVRMYADASDVAIIPAFAACDGVAQAAPAPPADRYDEAMAAINACIGQSTQQEAAPPEKSRCEMCADSKWKDACPECNGKIKYWWSEDRQFFCVLVNDGTAQATVSLSIEEAEELMGEVMQTPSFLALQQEAERRALQLMDERASSLPSTLLCPPTGEGK